MKNNENIYNERKTTETTLKTMNTQRKTPMQKKTDEKKGTTTQQTFGTED